MKNKKGFTIIELVVVIAIIAILSAIVLTNVAQYKKKGNDAAIKGQISQIRTAATDFFYTHNDYSGLCNPGTKCDAAEYNILNKLGGFYDNTYINANTYCISFYLSDHINKWCIDNTGYNGDPVSNECAAPYYNCKGS